MPHVAREIPKQKTNQTALYCVESQTGTCVPVLKRFWIETGSPGAPVLSRRTLELGMSEREGPGVLCSKTGGRSWSSGCHEKLRPPGQECTHL